MDVESLMRELDRASGQLKKSLPLAAGGASAEKAYGQAYQALVRAGVKPRLKGKYR